MEADNDRLNAKTKNGVVIDIDAARQRRDINNAQSILRPLPETPLARAQSALIVICMVFVLVMLFRK